MQNNDNRTIKTRNILRKKIPENFKILENTTFNICLSSVQQKFTPY